MATDAEQPSSFVDLVLAAADIEPSPEELQLFRLLYPILRMRADVIYSVDLGDEA